ncbi:PDZ domain-containing protein [Candidatus Binatus sp.]|uniref:PDZ domain-containing protein n=1 Tax=Candidatus Binatus sp. TaxID=2811406 RepID=UPI003BAF9B13
MGKNGGGQPTDAILTLEEALMRYKRKRDEAGAQTRVESVAEGNVHYVDFSPTVEYEQKGRATTYLGSAFEDASVSAQHDDSNAGTPADEDIVAVIDGIPRSLAELERIAAAEKAYDQDFPEPTLESAEVEDDDDLEAGDMDLMAHEANRHAMMRDYAFTAMGTALMVLVAVLVMHVPIVNNNNRPILMAQSIATPALKASSSVQDTDDLISSLVIVPDAQAQEASGPPPVKAPELEARIKDTLKVRAFPDIGVSVSTKGDAYLAGEVYSLDEARKISHIVHNVNGVNRVHFLHPDVRPAGGPAFFGVATTSAPAIWGAKVKNVIIGSPADKAGIKPGDVISEFDGNTVPDAKYLDLLVTHYSPGQRVQFRVWHNGQPEYLVARLGEVTTVASR